jgi:hypothetical protein
MRKVGILKVVKKNNNNNKSYIKKWNNKVKIGSLV